VHAKITADGGKNLPLSAETIAKTPFFAVKIYAFIYRRKNFLKKLKKFQKTYCKTEIYVLL